jgi:hypothetical protein
MKIVDFLSFIIQMFRIDIIEKIIVFSFMWIIMFALFWMALVGETTFFQVVNMLFVMVFFLLFHLSFKLWLKTMYSFWLCMIIYSVGALTLIYGYQFDVFKQSPLKSALGLEKLSAETLLPKLLLITVLIFLTGLQMNKFHNRIVHYFEEVKPGSDESGEKDLERKVRKLSSEVPLKFMKSPRLPSTEMEKTSQSFNQQSPAVS